MKLEKNLLAKIEKMNIDELEELFYSLGDYDQMPVGIDEFIESPEFLGNYFNGSMFPYWRKVLRDIYPSPFHSPYWCVSLRGSIGQGKSTIACAGVAYDLYLLLCMTRPQKTVGLIDSTKIVFAIFNVTLSLATDVVWDTLSQMFLNSPYFSRFIGPLGRKKRNEDTLFPKRIDFTMGSRIGHTLGKAVYEAILSEANFEVVQGQVYENFNSLLRRMSSRFMKKGGGVFGKIWVDSSESGKFSTVNKIVEQYKNDPGVLVLQNAIWDVKSHLYGSERFWVYVGSDVKPPEVIKPDHHYLIEEPENCIEVPKEHYKDFTADIDMALRDLAGRSTGSVYRLFKLKDKVRKAMRVTPLFPDSFELDFYNEADQIVDHCISVDYFKNPMNKNALRYIHIDTALSGDRLGIAASFVRGMKERKYRDVHTFQEVTESVPDVVTEWAFGIEPTKGNQIPLFKIRAFFKWLREKGYPIALVTTDGFQSAEMHQQLELMHFKSNLFSVDRTANPYVMLRSGVYEERCYLPSNLILEKEMENLEITPDGKKVDHPKFNADNTKGSKDIADAVCGSYNNAVANVHNVSIVSFLDEISSEQQNIKDMFWGTQS